MGKALLVGRFQKAGTEGAMNFDCTTDDAMGKIGEFRSNSLSHDAVDNKIFPHQSFMTSMVFMVNFLFSAELPAIFDGILVSEPCGSKKASPFRVMEM